MCRRGEKLVLTGDGKRISLFEDKVSFDDVHTNLSPISIYNCIIIITILFFFFQENNIKSSRY